MSGNSVLVSMDEFARDHRELAALDDTIFMMGGASPFACVTRWFSVALSAGAEGEVEIPVDPEWRYPFDAESAAVPTVQVLHCNVRYSSGRKRVLVGVRGDGQTDSVWAAAEEDAERASRIAKGGMNLGLYPPGYRLSYYRVIALGFSADASATLIAALGE
jgi:hypothetical protein